MPLSLSKINYKSFLINSLFSFIPISFIAGNLILNINILLFIIFTIAFYSKDIIASNFNNLDKIIIIFFAYTIFTGVLNNFYFKPETLPDDFTILIKSILYLRFLFFYFVIKFLILNNIINFKSFFIISSLCTIFVSSDLIYQLNFGKDIFGYVSQDPRRLSGPFGENEFIAGSYLQRFSLFCLLLFPFFFKDSLKNFNLTLIIISFFTLILFGLLIAGNRMPLILFLTLIIFMMFFHNKMRKLLLPFLFISSVILITLLNFNSNIRDHLLAFKTRISETVEFVSTVIIKDKKNKFEENKEEIIEWYKYSINVNGKVIPLTSTYIKEFNSGYQTWLEHKYFGGGIKSFRYNCVTFNCNTHPHNYYLEILSELGLFGFTLLIIIFFKVFYESFFKKYIKKANFNYNYNQVIIPFMFLFLIEIIPIKSTGSFFTTGNATYFFLIMSVTIALSNTSKGKI